MTKTSARKARVLRVYVAKGSRAARICRAYAGRPGQAPVPPEELAPGVPPTPAHDLKDRGGTIIPDLTFTNLYVGGDTAWAPSDRQNIDRALAAAMADQHLNNVMLQYFRGRAQITSTFRPSRVLAGPASATVTQQDIEDLVRSLLGAGQLTGFPFSSSVFNFLLPRGTVLTLDDGNGQAARGQAHRPADPTIPVEDTVSSLQGLGGFHGSVDVGQQRLYYAVGVFSEKQANGQVNGIPVFDQPWKNVVATFYHELNESRTDADVEAANNTGDESLIGWTSNQGEEVGDFPVFEANPLTEVFQEVPLADGTGAVPIQFMYSNFVHGPEGPISAPHPLPGHHGHA